MKLVHYSKVVFMILVIALSTSCGTVYRTSGKHKKSPGKIKKFTGSKSAKPYAPGQHKKKHKKNKHHVFQVHLK